MQFGLNMNVATLQYKALFVMMIRNADTKIEEREHAAEPTCAPSAMKTQVMSGSISQSL